MKLNEDFHCIKKITKAWPKLQFLIKLCMGAKADLLLRLFQIKNRGNKY